MAPNWLTASPWLSFPKPNPGAEVRLFCLPYAGAGSNVFYKWPRVLAPTIEVCLVHLPGRDHRLKERPYTSMPQLVEALGRQLLPYIDKRSAFFGHSLGGLVSFELARYLRNAYGWQPDQIFVSGCSAPQVTPRFSPIHSLPMPQFLLELERLGGRLDPPSANDQAVSLMLPTLRADLALRANYAYASEASLDCAIKAYGGMEDRHVKYQQLDLWRRETTGPFSLHIFAGGHFFINTAEALVLADLSETLGERMRKLSNQTAVLTLEGQFASADR